MSGPEDCELKSLHDAIQSTNLDLLESLLKDGSDPNAVDDKGMTALNFTCSFTKLMKIDLEMIQLLIQYGADVNIQDEDGNSPMMNLFCDESNDMRVSIEALKLLLKKGADVTRVNHKGQTIFRYIILCNPTNTDTAVALELLLKNGTDPNMIVDNETDETALNFICDLPKLTRVHLKMIQILLHYKADVNNQDKDGYTPIMSLFRYVEDYKLRWKVLNLLLENQADVTLVDNQGYTILHYIFFNDEAKNPIIFEVVELLLKSGVDVNKQNENGFSALYVATEHCVHVKVIDLLLKNGADPNIVDDTGRTALHSICGRTKWTEVHLEMIQLLIKYKADINIRNFSGNTPIMNLFFGTKDCNSRLEVFKLLAKYHVDDTSLDEFGRKMLPEMFELEVPISNIAKEVEFLLEIGVNVNILSKYGFSALHNAVHSLQLEQVEFLLKNGADPNITDVNGDIPLNYNFKSFDSIKLLRKLEKFFPILELNIEYNADISHCGGDGKTVLHSLIIGLSSSSFRNFLVYDDEEENHLERISKYVHQYVEVLLKHGLDVNVKDRDGLTALNSAVSYCNYDIAKILVEHGADANTVQFKGGFLENKVPQSLNLLTTLNVLAIIELWQSKGFQINNYQYLRIFKFLTLFDDSKMNNDSHSSLLELWHKSRVPSHIHWKDVFEFGSGSAIRKYVETIFLAINDSSNCTNFDIAFLKKGLYKTIKLYLCFIEYGNMYMDIETYNYLRNKLNSLVSENPAIDELYRYCRDERHKDIRDQVDLAKEMIISNNISYLDLCTSSPDKTYYLLQKYNFKLEINSNTIEALYFRKEFLSSGEIIRGYITKALVRRLLTLATTDSIKLLSHGILPDLCCDKIIKCLDVIDLVSVYEAVVNYKC